MCDWDVQSWLEEIGYDKRYAQSFIDNGYDLPNLCANLKDEDLDAIEVDKEDRNRLFEHVERLRHHSFARVPISYDSPMPNGSISRSFMNANGSIGSTKLPVDNFGASQEPSVKSPDSLCSVSHELPEHPPTSTAEVQLYSEALNQPPTHAPKKPPRSSKKQGKPIPPSLPKSSSGGSLSKLQLKLKLKQELQQDHILITEPPYVLESGELNEELLQQLAVDYAEKFRIDSLEMYEALIELWRVQTNLSPHVTPMCNAEASKLSPGQDKATAVQKQPAAQSTTYMDPYNGPPSKPRRSAPPAPHNKRSSDKRKTERSDETDMVSSSVNSSIASAATNSITNTRSYHSSFDGSSLSSPPSASDIFFYEDVDELPEINSGVNPSYVDSRSRELSSEKEHSSLAPPEKQKPLSTSESVPALSNHVGSDKTPAKKRGGLKKLLTRSSKKKLPSLPNSPVNDLMANTITMSDEDRAELMEKFKKHELSQREVLSKVTAYEEEQRSKRDALFNELNQDETPPLPPRSSVMLLPPEKNGVPGNKMSRILPASKANIKRSQSTEAVDNISLSSSTSSSSDMDPIGASHKPTAGVKASVLKFFKKRKDNSKSSFSASNLTHSSSMPSIVIEEKLNELNKSAKVPPPTVPSAYSKVFDSIPIDSGMSLSTSLPRSGSGNDTGSSSSSSSTMPSRGSPSSSPTVNAKHTPPRYHHKKQQQANGCVRKTSPLAQTKPDLTRIPERKRQSSPEILICTVSDAGVPIEWQNKDEEKEMQTDVRQDQAEEDSVHPNNRKPQPSETVKETEVIIKSSEVHSVSDVNVVDTGSHSPPAVASKPAVASRPKIPPKPSIPATMSRTDKTIPKVPAKPGPVHSQAFLHNKPPVPKPRAKTPSNDEGRHSCSPVFDDDELDSKQIVPPPKPPRRRNTQMSSSSSRDTPSPVPIRHTIFTTAPSAYSLDSSREMFSPPLPISKPALPPKPRRTSSSTSTVGLEGPLVEVADRLNVDEIDLANIPYSTTWGECGIPVPLIERYARELSGTFDGMTQYLDQIRRHRLEQCQRVWVPMEKDYTINNQKVDTSSLKTWLTSIGLPMYYSEVTKLGFRSVESMKKFSPRTYNQIQFRLPLHAQLLHKAIQALYRNL